ncbi:MAG: hypothetical protein U9N76_06060, partial [Candidatus Marinimicrobia bacterium]|nr:hypothetical protein [Candidatus Neomarinimicrobiota bacterium]
MKLFRKILLTLLIIGTIAMAQDEVIINEKFEDYSIAINDTLKSNVHLKIFVGDVNIAGVVYGKITVYGGDIVIDSTAVINGELKNFGGKVDKSNNTDVQGDIVEARIKGNYAKVPKFNFDRGHKHRIHIGDDKNNNISHTFSEKHPFIKYSPGFSFNRQEGFYLQIGDMQNGVGNLDGLDLGGTIGYAFGMKEWEANGIVRYNFMKNDNSTVYFNLYHDTKHFDNWRTADIDNFISYLFKKEDNYDRILVEGYKIGAQQIFGDFMKFKAEYISQSEDTIGLYKNDTLGTYRPIATNINGLEFEPGKISGYRVSNSISFGKDGMSFPGEMLLSGIYENYGGDWDFEKLHLEVDYIATIANTIQNRT